MTVVSPIGKKQWQWQWSRWCFPRGGNNDNSHGGVSRGGETIVTVVFLMGEETGGATRWGQSSVANVCVGDAIKIPAVVKERGGITNRQAKNPSTVTRRCGGNAGLGAAVLKTGMVFNSRNDVCHGTRCHGPHPKCVTGDTVVPSVIKEVNKTGHQCGGKYT